MSTLIHGINGGSSGGMSGASTQTTSALAGVGGIGGANVAARAGKAKSQAQKKPKKRYIFVPPSDHGTVLTISRYLNPKKNIKVFDVFDPNTPNFLCALPPELRNLISFEVLISSTVQEVQLEEGKKSTVPGLLQTCRQLRSEAFAVWCCHNTYNMRIDLPGDNKQKEEDKANGPGEEMQVRSTVGKHGIKQSKKLGFPPALAWVRYISSQPNFTSFQELRLHVYGALWTKLAAFAPFIEFLRETGIKIAVIDTRQLADKDEMARLRSEVGHKVFLTLSYTYQKAKDGVQTLVDLGELAYKDGSTEQKLKEMVDDKVQELLSSGPGAKASRQWHKINSARPAALNPDTTTAQALASQNTAASTIITTTTPSMLPGPAATDVPSARSFNHQQQLQGSVDHARYGSTDGHNIYGMQSSSLGEWYGNRDPEHDLFPHPEPTNTITGYGMYAEAAVYGTSNLMAHDFVESFQLEVPSSVWPADTLPSYAAYDEVTLYGTSGLEASHERESFQPESESDPVDEFLYFGD